MGAHKLFVREVFFFLLVAKNSENFIISFLITVGQMLVGEGKPIGFVIEGLIKFN